MIGMSGMKTLSYLVSSEKGTKLRVYFKDQVHFDKSKPNKSCNCVQVVITDYIPVSPYP